MAAGRETQERAKEEIGRGGDTEDRTSQKEKDNNNKQPGKKASHHAAQKKPKKQTMQTHNKRSNAETMYQTP